MRSRWRLGQAAGDFDGFVALAQKSLGKFSFGSPDLGSFRHVMGEAILLDPVRTGKVMAGPIGSAALSDFKRTRP